jgi:hypothetical protein
VGTTGLGIVTFESFFHTPSLIDMLANTYIDVESLVYIMFFAFLGCSSALSLLIYWLFWENKKIQQFYSKYFSELVAPDYYKGYKKPKLHSLFQSVIDRDMARRIDADELRQSEGGQISSVYGFRPYVFPKSPIPDGPYKTYYAEGQLELDCTFKNEKLHGAFRSYYEDGTLHQEKFYTDGKLDGVFRAFDEKGILYFETTYKKGVQHGADKIYNERGVIQFKDTYENGRKINRKTYDDSGNIVFDQNEKL